MGLISFENVSKTYNNKSNGIHNVNLKIDKGEFVYIIGSSGAGKSTILNLMSGMIIPDEGEISVADRKLGQLTKEEFPYFRRSYGIISPKVSIIPEFSVYHNVALPLHIAHKSTKYIKQMVPVALGSVGMRDFMKTKAGDLSGGEKIKVAIARAIVTDPAILVADEPTSSLDADTAWDIISLLEHINKSGTTIVVATHAKELVNITRKRVVTMENGKILNDSILGKYNS